MSDDAPRALPVIDFATFILSIASAALVQLGELPDPQDGEKRRNLALAKHNIDLLGLLDEKTRGNLDEGERKLMHSLLYDLRVKYVDAQKAENSQSR
jgi:hypothetical protein